MTMVNSAIGLGQAHSVTQKLSSYLRSCLVALQEWCGIWEAENAGLKPECIGHETGGRFLQTSAPGTIRTAASRTWPRSAINV